MSTTPRIMEIFDPLDDEANFSLRRDFLDNPKKQILIIQSHPKVRERLKNLLALAFQVLIQELLSRENIDLYPRTLLSKKQYWFILDEFFSLGRIPSLRDALTAGRSKGMSLVIATQEFGGIQENYPERGFLDQLKGNTAVKACFRLGSDVDLKVASDLFSNSEITGLQESHSLGVVDYRDGVQESEKIEKRQVVLPGEIQRLRKNEFFASVPGQPVSRYQTKYFEPLKIAPAREEYPPGHWERETRSRKVVRPESKEEAKAPGEKIEGQRHFLKIEALNPRYLLKKMAVIKTNYFQNSDTAIANLRYIQRDKTQSGERAVLHNQRGEELGKKEIKEVKGEMENAEMYRRIIFAPDPKLRMNHEEMKQYTISILAEYKHKHRANFTYVFVCHDHYGREYAHVLAWGTREQLYMNKDDWREMRQMALSREKTLRLDRANASAIKAVLKTYDQLTGGEEYPPGYWEEKAEAGKAVEQEGEEIWPL